MSLADTIAMHGIGVDMGRLNGAVRELEYESFAAVCVGTVYDACTSFMVAPGPLPLVGTEAWQESDDTYRARLFPANVAHIWRDVHGDDLDTAGRARDMPRARLVLAKEKA